MENARLKYKPEINSVDAIRLEKKDFKIELIANGRLSAAARSSMAFKSQGIISEIAVENGQRVEKGAELAVQDATEQELETESARIALEKAELDYLDVLEVELDAPRGAHLVRRLHEVQLLAVRLRRSRRVARRERNRRRRQ